MKRNIFFIVLICFVFANLKTLAMPNPWIDCKDDLSCGAKKAGFDFPLRLKNYTVRAMKDIIEIKFPLDKKRIVYVRKSQNFKGQIDQNGIADISGDYTTYPVNKTIYINKGIPFSVRGEKK